jgi:gliding motility-associated-like protein
MDLLKDCDVDGITDAVEITNGSDPFDPCDPEASSLDCVTGVFIPTGFSPNRDNNNEEYQIIVGKDVVSFTFQIFDRWGNKMFVSSEKGFTWDGTFNGEICNSGVYAYVMEIVFEDGSAELRSGNITLIR